MCCLQRDERVSLTLQDLTVQNSVGGAGGALYFSSGAGGLLTVTNVDFYLDNATNGSFGGGGIYKAGASAMELKQARFVSCTAAGFGVTLPLVGPISAPGVSSSQA